MSTTPTQHVSPEDDRLWQAFCYVHGDMSADDAERFEQQMLEDAELCAMVADTSLLIAAVAATDRKPLQKTPASPAASGITQYLAVTSVVCCCAVAALFLGRYEFAAPNSASTVASIDDAAFLLNAWAEIGAPETEPDVADLESAEDEVLVVPDWMLAALSAEEVADSADSSSDVESPDSPEVL